MIELNHPKPKQLEFASVSPAVHWAKIQRLPVLTGNVRRIYDFEFIYVYHGEVVVHYSALSLTTRAGAGELLLIPSALEHQIETKGDPETLLIGIHFSFFNETIQGRKGIIFWDPDNPVLLSQLPVHADGSPVFELYYPDPPQEAPGWMKQVVKEYVNAEEGYELVCRSCMLQLLTLLIRMQSRPARSNHPKYQEAILALAADMKARPDRTWSNGQAARRLYVSEDHYIRLFKDIVGMTPNKFVQEARHREAKRLLSETLLSVEEIGRQVGYEDLQNFSKVFKKWEGLSPRDYRKRNQLF